MEKNKLSELALQQRLTKCADILNFDHRGERTFIVIPGLNHPKTVDLSNVSGLRFYEERMLFFIFLLKYKKTKIVYVATEGFNEKLFDYYLSMISSSPEDLAEKKSRLIYIPIDDQTNDALTRKILKQKKFINRIKKQIINPETTILRCYNPTEAERKLSLLLGVPLFGSNQKYDFVGTKSGGRKVFKLAGANLIPGFSELKNFTELSKAMVRLAVKHPGTKRLMIKRNYSSSGKGNCVFYWQNFVEKFGINPKKMDQDKTASLVLRNFNEFASFQNVKTDYAEYKMRFNKTGGIVELYIEGEIKFSPSTQVLITSKNKPRIISNHEQILGGPDNQVYLGCKFPSLESHRRLIIAEGEKIAGWLAKKGVIGNFAIDYVVTYEKGMKKPVVYPIEINLRKGGTTHIFRIAYYLTGAKYNPKSGLLTSDKTPIYYYALEAFENEKYKGLDPLELINLVSESKIAFDKKTKKGALIYMPGMVSEFGKFGSICLGHSPEEAEEFYKKLRSLINSYINRSSSSKKKDLEINSLISKYQ